MAIAETNLEYLKLLARRYSNIQAASTEIINLNAILNLPKGTEHFISDVHGEYEAFLHVLKNGSGTLKRKIRETFADSLMEKERQNLATLIYYPQQKLPLILQEQEFPNEWYRVTLFRLIKILRVVSSKYTRSKVRKALPPDFAYVIEELLHDQESIENRHEYYHCIIDTIIATGRANAFIIAISEVIQRLNIDHLHVIGDVYDRGPGAHIIMDRLMKYHSLDFQWGNHDILWMAAAAGSEACVANVIRIALRYSNTITVEDGYAISMMPLATFAMDAYADDPCRQFTPKLSGERNFSSSELKLMAKMHKAIAVIQFKLEAQIIRRRPEYQMESRLLLDKVDYEKGVITIGGKSYPLNDTNFPTIDPANPFQLTEEEASVMDKLVQSFRNSERLQAHVRFLYATGSMYLIYNNNLLYHGCIPMTDDGKLRSFNVDDQTLGPRQMLDRVERLIRQAYFSSDAVKRQDGQDMMWYLWCGEHSSLFGKDKMATYERYFVDDKETHAEKKNPYYTYRDEEKTADMILEAFGLNPKTGHIFNGHVPVKVVKGENPVKAGGKLIVIDGGFSKAYQKETGIAGYTVVFNSYGFLLAEHHPFESAQKAIEEEVDLDSETMVLHPAEKRIRVKDTDAGKEIQRQIDNLQALLSAFRKGLIKESQ